MNTILHGNTNEISPFDWEDIRCAIRTFTSIRKKNRIPTYTHEGRYGLLITLTVKKQIHVTWRKKWRLEKT